MNILSFIYKQQNLRNFKWTVLTAFALITIVSCNENNDEPEVAKNYNLSINLINYDQDEIITHGNILFELEIENKGTETITAGSTLYASARINGVLFSLDLLSSDPTLFVLDEDLAPGNKIIIDAGYLEGNSSLAYLQKESAEFCIILWGVGEASVNNIGELDTDPSDNQACVTYSTYDFEVSLKNYSSGETITEGSVEMAFDVVNHSDVTFPVGSKLMVSARIAGNLYSLDLTNVNPTEVEITEPWESGEEFSLDPGALDGALTLAYLGETSGDFCIVVWGIGETSVGDDFPDDRDGSNNESCVFFTTE